MTSSGNKQSTDVLIVGAGPVGLSLAIELSMRGIDCLVVERNDRIGIAPRAKTTNVRTRTHLRRWGMASRLAEASPFGVGYPSTVSFVTRLGGQLLCRFADASNCAPGRNPLYPEHGQWIPQYKLEQALRAHLETLAPDGLRLNAELVHAWQRTEGVEAEIRDGTDGTTMSVRSRYLVGADGARSTVRKLLGIRMDGTYGLSSNYNIVFHAPGLADRHPHGPGTMYWQVNPDAPGLIGPMDEGDIWFFMPTRLPQGSALSDEDAVSLIRRSTGIDIPYRIVSSDSWVASRLIAERYREQDMFLVGDACHLHPPFGGYGMNMGVGDAVDLGWKLAARLQGWGGERLLESYEIERRPVHVAVMEEAVANHSVLANDLITAELETESEAGDRARAKVAERIQETKSREFHTLGTVLGSCYAPSPLIVSDARPAGSQHGPAYVPMLEPGCLAPHTWLADGRSLFDRFGRDFTLVIGPDASTDEARLGQAEASRLGIDLALVDLAGEPGCDLYEGRLALIRPDQHIAWRGALWSAGALETAAGRAGMS